MHIKDRLFWWFIKNIIMSRNEIIDKPGFIILRISEKMYLVNIREILLPENIFCELENVVVKKYGETGKQILYSAGKKFGYMFAKISKYPLAEREKDFAKFSYFLVCYLESIYAKNLEYSIDFDKKKFILKAKNWIVCNKNGLGHIFLEGTGAGMISYAFDDYSIEGVQLKCEGRGDEYCELICATPQYFKNNKIKFITEKECNFKEFNSIKYNTINSVRNTKYAKNSFKNLLDGGFFKYKEGEFLMKDERFVLIEASIIYFLEKELNKLGGGKDILWKISFEWGKNFSKKFEKQHPCKFINDLFPALGFGDFFAFQKDKKYKIYINYFPWTEMEDECDFVMLRGILSGVISGMTGKKVEMKKVKKMVTVDGFSLVIEE